MTDNQPIQERKLNLAVRIIKVCQFLDLSGGVGKVLSSQLIRTPKS